LRGGTSPEALWIDYAWVGGLKPEDNRLQDWAVLRLADLPRGNYGHVTVKAVDIASQLPYTTNLVGYSDDRNNGDDPSLHSGCYVMQVVEGKLFHECDGAAGVSGGPLMSQINGNWYIVGITVSEYRQGAPDSVKRPNYSQDYANVGVPAAT